MVCILLLLFIVSACTFWVTRHGFKVRFPWWIPSIATYQSCDLICQMRIMMHTSHGCSEDEGVKTQGSAQNKHLIHCNYCENKSFHLFAPSLPTPSAYFGEGKKISYLFQGGDLFPFYIT